MRLPRFKIAEEIDRRVEVIKLLHQHKQKLGYIAQFLYRTINAGGRVFIAGNGGSAAEASHLTAELVGGYKIDRVSIDARCLSSDGATLTAIGNDFGFHKVFTRQLQGQFQSEDVAIFFTTSGNSQNVLDALSNCCQGQNTVLISGKAKGSDGGDCKGLAKVEIIIDSEEVSIVQECHLILVHILCDLLERKLQQEPDSRFQYHDDDPK